MMKAYATSALLTATLLAGCASAQDLPTVRVTADNTRIDRSCEVVIPRGTVIADADGNGVIHIVADNITVRFREGSELRGNDGSTPPEQYSGWGIRLDGHRGVTVEAARVHGYRVGLYATEASGLTLAGGDYSDQYRPKLTSTVQREGGNDWLHPHHNDNNEWLNNYAAAVYIEDSDNITVRDVRIREGQHGVLLDRVNHSKIYDNDVSFISGWGLALWRSSDNIISRNAFDFCVRGHSEGIYNRGQDSAGILFFEQCSRNLIAENSATHGGDGFFGFAGLEALGVNEQRDASEQQKVGCNDNIFLYNDLSYAPAHGLEMTFSFGNIIAHNRFVENAICGVWGGFSQDTLITNNLFDGNGGMAYGMERGGVNIEHSINNTVADNDFVNNRVGVAMWWDNPGDVGKWAWGSNYGELVGNTIANNRFIINDEDRPFYRVTDEEKRIGVWLRDDEKKGHLSGTVVAGNDFDVQGERPLAQLIDEGITVSPSDAQTPKFDVEAQMKRVLGDKRPVVIRDGVPYSARENLRGRHNIIMGDYGPWDHEGTLVRAYDQSASSASWQVFGTEGALRADVRGNGVKVEVTDDELTPGAKRVSIAGEPGVHAYDLRLRSGDWSYTASGTLVSVRWDAVAFNYPLEDDPREDVDKWAQHARGDRAVRFQADAIDFPFGGGGISDQALPDHVRAARLSPDQFGLIAEAKLPLTPGRWRITTVSDDGVRVMVDDDTVIDNWTWHVPTTDRATLNIRRTREVTIRLMYFELNGGATLSFKIEPVEEGGGR